MTAIINYANMMTAIYIWAKIRGHATHSHDPAWFTTAPIPAIRKLLDRVGWSVGDVDLFEITEAFAVVATAARHDLGIGGERSSGRRQPVTVIRHPTDGGRNRQRREKPRCFESSHIHADLLPRSPLPRRCPGHGPAGTHTHVLIAGFTLRHGA